MTNDFTPAQCAVLRSQLTNELTEAIVYDRLALRQPAGHNRDLLAKIAADERKHARQLADLLGEEGAPNRFKAFLNTSVASLFGLTFGLKLMENGEGNAGDTYRNFAGQSTLLTQIAADEDAHETALLDMLDDEHLNYMGAIVLGLNDALVELTGALAGFTFALNGSRLIAVTGLITGIAAALSMASSAFLSARADREATGDRHPGKIACYTGVAYVITVLVLVLPYLVLSNVKLALVLMLLLALAIIALFNFYISVAKGTSFKRSFGEMASISTAVAAISFGIGYVLDHTMGAH